MDIEKNDVDLSKLFKWTEEVTINDKNGDPVATVYMRVAGDSDINKARTFALRESANLREDLNEEGSEMYDALIKDISHMERDDLLSAIRILRYPYYSLEAKRTLNIKFPVEPDSDATMEEQEEYQKEVDEFPETYRETLDNRISEIADEDIEEFKGKSVDTIKDAYKRSLINALCQQEMNQRFLDMCVFQCTFKDKEMTNRAFDTFEDYDNASSLVKDQLVNAYNNLEMDVNEVKK